MARDRDYEIYLIEDDETWYIGSTTVGYQKRWREHRLGTGGAPRLAARIQEVGEDNMRISVVESSHGDPIEAERRWYDTYLADDPRDRLNIQRPGVYPDLRGRKIPQEHREKLSKSLVGRRPSVEARAKQSATIRAKEKPGGMQECYDCGLSFSAARLNDHLEDTGHWAVFIPSVREGGERKIEVECYDCDLEGSTRGMNVHRQATQHRLCPNLLPPAWPSLSDELLKPRNS